MLARTALVALAFAALQCHHGEAPHGAASLAAVAFLRAGPYMDQWIDYSRTATLEDVIDSPERFVPVGRQYPGFGVIDGAIWLKMQLTGVPAGARERHLLEVANPTLRGLRFYCVADGSVTCRYETSMLEPLEGRAVPHQHFLFPIDFGTAGGGDIYLRIDSDYAITLPIFVWSELSFYRSDTRRNFAFGLFFGLLLAMALYNLFLFISVRDRAYLYYVLYITCFGLFFSSVYGYAALFFLDWLGGALLRFAPFFSLATSIFALSFARTFLLLREQLPRASRLVDVLIVVHILALPVVVFAPPPIATKFANLLPLAAIVLVVYSTFAAIRRRFRPAYYFLAAWALLLISVSLFILMNFRIVPGNFFTYHGQLFGAGLEAVLLSFALGFRINSLKEAEESARLMALEEERRALAIQQRMSDSFARFVPTEFLRYLDRENILDVVHGDAVQRHLTVLFTDIRGFTGISERLGSEATFRLLNQYLGQVAPIIRAHRGVIDKFIGDAIMALFERADDGVRAAVALLRAIESFNAGRPDGQPEISIGIGLHHGEVMLGTVGSPDRLETTVIGDTVNLASRIESTTKRYGTRIILSDAVFRALHDEFPDIREIDTVYVKGKERPVVLFENFSAYPAAERDRLQQAQSFFLAGMAYFRSADLASARQNFSDYLERCPFDGVGRLYLDRIIALEKRPPAELREWSGIYETWDA